MPRPHRLPRTQTHRPLNARSIEAIIADPAGKKVMDKDLPDLQKHPAFEQIKGMSLRQVQPYSNGAISDELIAKVEADLAAAKKAD